MTSRLPTLLIPGLLCTPRLFEAQLPLFWRYGPVMFCDTSAAADIVTQAGQILADAPPYFRLCGLSMGGYLAFEILRQAPERVKALILFDTSARPDTPESRSHREQMIRLAGQDGFERLVAALYPKLVATARQQDMVLEAMVAGMADDVGPAAFVRQQQIIMSRPDSRPDLAAIACPTLVAVGADDSLTPPAIAAEIAEGIPEADLVILEGCGHLAPLEQPARVNEVLAHWLAGEGPFAARRR